MRFLRIALVALTLYAQESSQEPIRVSVKTVQLDVTVLDRSGKHVSGLGRDAFHLTLGGVPVRIDYLREVRREDKSDAPHGAVPTPPLPVSFSERTPRPEEIRTNVAFLIDDLSLSAESVGFVKKALSQYIEKDFAAGDLIAIVRESAGIGALQDFSSDRSILRAAVNAIRWVPGWNARTSSYEVIDPTMANKSSVRRAEEAMRARETGGLVLESACRILGGLRDQPGRKAIVLMTDGISSTPKPNEIEFDSRLDLRISRCIDQATRAGATVYVIDCRGLQSLTATAADTFASPGDYLAHNDFGDEHDPVSTAGTPGKSAAYSKAPTGNGDWVHAATAERRAEHEGRFRDAQTLAMGTGGYVVSDTNDILHALRRIDRDLSQYYVVGFAPDPALFDNSHAPAFVKLRMTVDGGHARQPGGFYAVPDGFNPQPGELLGLSSPFHASGIHLSLNAAGLSTKSKNFVYCSLRVEANDLHWAGPDTNQSSIVHLVLRAFDVSGQRMDGGIDQDLRVSLDANGTERAKHNGLIYSALVEVPRRGPYQIRAAMREEETGKLGNASSLVWAGGAEAPLSDAIFSNWVAKEGDITPAPLPPTYGAGEDAEFSLQPWVKNWHGAVQVSATYYADGREVARSADRHVKSETVKNGAALWRSRLAVPPDLAPGDYAVDLIFTGASGERAHKWTKLSVGLRTGK